MSLNVWVHGGDEKAQEAAALEQARSLGYSDPVALRRVEVEGSRGVHVGVIVGEREGGSVAPKKPRAARASARAAPWPLRSLGPRGRPGAHRDARYPAGHRGKKR